MTETPNDGEDNTTTGRRHLLNGVDCAKFIGFFPCVQTFTLARCTSPAGGSNTKNYLSRRMQEAVQKLVDKYPVLRGRLVKTDQNSKLWVEESFFPNTVQDFFSVLDLSNQVDIPSLGSLGGDKKVSTQDLLEYMDQYIIPKCSALQTIDESCQKEKRLFSVDLVLLKDALFAYSVRVSHGIVDAASYYYLIAEFVTLMDENQNEQDDKMVAATQTKSLQWGNEKVSQGELLDDSRDRATCLGPRFGVCVLRNLVYRLFFGTDFTLILSVRPSSKSPKKKKSKRSRSQNRVVRLKNNKLTLSRATICLQLPFVKPIISRPCFPWSATNANT